MTKELAEYVVYRGEELLVMGTVAECARHLNVQPKTIWFYNTPCYKKRVAKRNSTRGKGYLTVTRLDVEDE